MYALDTRWIPQFLLDAFLFGLNVVHSSILCAILWISISRSLVSVHLLRTSISVVCVCVHEWARFVQSLSLTLCRLYSEKLCIRPLKAAHELTMVAICKAIFVRQLTIFIADSLFSFLPLSFSSFTRFIRKIYERTHSFLWDNKNSYYSGCIDYVALFSRFLSFVKMIVVLDLWVAGGYPFVSLSLCVL